MFRSPQQLKKKKARTYHERHNPNRIYLVLLPVLNGLLQKNKGGHYLRELLVLMLMTYVFLLQFLGPHIPEVHIHTDGKATESHKPRHRCKFTYKRPDKLKLFSRKHTITQTPSPLPLRQAEPGSAEASTSVFTVEGQCLVQRVRQHILLHIESTVILAK